MLVGILVLLCGKIGSATSPQQLCFFKISIDRSMWETWGFEYPTTYVFTMEPMGRSVRVFWRDSPTQNWRPLAERTSHDFYNGGECFRIDHAKQKVYVSIGFHKTNTLFLEFRGVGNVTFDEVAKYYDARKSVYTLSNDNWGKKASAHPGAPWQGMNNDASDKYQAVVHVCRHFHLPVTIAINSRAEGKPSQWDRMQEELGEGRVDWEPAVHTLTHPCSHKAYLVRGFKAEILDCRDDILAHLRHIPYGQHVFTFILPCAYKDPEIEKTAAGQFLFLRDWNRHDNLDSIDYASWNKAYRYYGIGGLQTVSYDAVLQKRHPAGRYFAVDVARLNKAFDRVYQAGGIFYAMWHADRYQNSVIYDLRPGVDGKVGSTLMQHLTHVANRKNVWYVANGWLYSYRYVAQHVVVTRVSR